MLLLWVLAPLVLALLTLGVGLLVERAAGHRLPGPLLFVVGYTGIVCSTQLTVRLGATAPLTPYVVVALALAGALLGARRVRASEVDRWAVALGVGLFAIFGLPAIATGEPTVLGYTSLGDASGHFGIVDQLMHNGYSVANLGPTSFAGNVSGLFASAYPTGSHTVLGTLRALTGTDVAWLLQPYLAMQAALVGLGLQTLVAPYVSRRWLAAGVAGLATGAGLVYSYVAEQQAIKELGALVCIVALVAVVRPLLLARLSWRAAVPAAVVVGGGLGVLNLALAPWIAPLLALAAVTLLVLHGRRGLPAIAVQVGAFAVVATVLALPTLTRSVTFVKVANVSLTGAVELGNLGHPLYKVQALGVWPTGDFRNLIPDGRALGWVLLGSVALAAGLGAIQVVRTRAWPVGLFAVVSLVGFVAIAGRASPWAEAKGLVLLSPVALLLAGFGVAIAWERARRAEAAALAAALVLGVGWTDALSYHVIDATPHTRFAELQAIDDRFAGQGPSLHFEADDFLKHFLRDTRPTSANEGIPQGLITTAPGRVMKVGFSSDTDDFTPALLAQKFRLLVIRQGPTASRPPVGWERAWQGDYYDVWRRTPEAGRVLAHLALGDRFDAGGPAPCARVRSLAGVARLAGGRLAYAPRPPLAVLRTTKFPSTVGWITDGADPDAYRPSGPGSVDAQLRTGGGLFHVWVEASVGRPLTISVDGREVGSLRDQLNPHYAATRIGTVRLDPGRHSVRLVIGGGSLDPRNGGQNRLLGPVYLTPAADPGAVRVQTVAAADWRSLCGRHADWIEVVR